MVAEANIAVIHTVFNLAATAMLLPFTRQLEKLACLTIKDTEEESEAPFLDERFLNTPSLATDRALNVTEKMARLSEGTLLGALEMVGNYNEKAADTLSENEDTIDMYEDVISTYLVKLSQKNLSENDSKSVQRVLHGIGDFERISDHAMNIVGAAKEIEEKKAVFSEGAMAGLNVMMDAIKEIINNATLAFINNDVKLAAKVEPLEQVIDRIRDKLKEAERLKITILNEYGKYLTDAYIKLTLKKLELIIDGYRSKLYSLRTKKQKEAFLQMFNQIEDNEKKGRGR